MTPPPTDDTMTDGTMLVLDSVQVRVLGSLVEKAATTPGSYPLTLNALRNACNQATSRDPVVDYDDRQVEAALLGLRDLRLARPVREAGARVTKFRHAADEVIGLDPPALAALGVLLLRGPQTAGEVRTRTVRHHDFATVEDVVATLSSLADRGLAVQLSRGAGQKEPRWTHLLQGEPVVDAGDGAAGRPVEPSGGGPLTASNGRPGHAPLFVDTWLEGAAAVATAIGDPDVALWWEEPSVLADQTVGSVAGHLARGGVWVVADYLATDAPGSGPDFDSAAEYFATLADRLDDHAHQAVRDRGASVAAAGAADVAAKCRRALDEVAEVVVAADPGRLMTVYGGLTMRLDDYLATRIVEQAVHLDDLRRSVDGLELEIPDAVVDVAVAVGADVLRMRRGRTDAMRALYRHGFQAALPVL